MSQRNNYMGHYDRWDFDGIPDVPLYDIVPDLVEWTQRESTEKGIIEKAAECCEKSEGFLTIKNEEIDDRIGIDWNVIMWENFYECLEKEKMGNMSQFFLVILCSCLIPTNMVPFLYIFIYIYIYITGK